MPRTPPSWRASRRRMRPRAASMVAARARGGDHDRRGFQGARAAGDRRLDQAAQRRARLAIALPFAATVASARQRKHRAGEDHARWSETDMSDLAREFCRGRIGARIGRRPCRSPPARRRADAPARQRLSPGQDPAAACRHRQGHFRAARVQDRASPHRTIRAASATALRPGKFDIVHSAVDNALAMIEVAKHDVVIVTGGDSGMNEFFVQGEIKSFADHARPHPGGRRARHRLCAAEEIAVMMVRAGATTPPKRAATNSG